MSSTHPHPGSAPSASTVPSASVPEEGIGTILSNIVTDFTTLVRQEAELAKVEMKHEATKASKAAGLFGAGGVAAHIALIFLTLALALGLAEWFDIDLGWTALIVGLLWAVVSAAVVSVARSRMRTVNPVPHQTINTIKEGIT